MKKPIHAHKKDLFCNKCEKYIDKWTETNVIDEQVYCLHCENWLAGEYDTFGDVMDTKEAEDG